MKNKLLEDEKYLEEEKRVSAFRILRNKLQKEKEHGYIHPFPGYVENEGERTIIDLNNYRLHVPWHDKLRGAASYGLYRNIEGSFQMTQLGIFPHKLLQFKGYLANRTVDLDRGPDLLCRLSGEIFTRDSIVTLVQDEFSDGHVQIHLATLFAREYAAYKLWKEEREAYLASFHELPEPKEKPTSPSK